MGSLSQAPNGGGSEPTTPRPPSAGSRGRLDTHMASLLNFLPRRHRDPVPHRSLLLLREGGTRQVDSSSSSAGFPMEVLVGRRRERGVGGQHRVGGAVEHGPRFGSGLDSTYQRHAGWRIEVEAQGHPEQHEGRHVDTRTVEESCGQDGNSSERDTFPTALLVGRTGLTRGVFRREDDAGGFFEDGSTASQGISEGIRGHGMAGDEEAQHEGQLAALRREEGEEEEAGPSDEESFPFPPQPPDPGTSLVWNPLLAGETLIEEEAKEAGLLWFLKGGTKRKREEDEAPRGGKRFEDALQRVGDNGSRGDEGRRSHAKKRITRKRHDLPRLRLNGPGVRGSQKHKWKTAIQTARNFRLNRIKKDSAMSDFRKEYYANSSRKARASIRKTVEKILENLGLKHKEQRWSCNAMEQLGTVLRDSDYKAGVAYLTEYKHMLIEEGIQWSLLLQKTFGQVARAINRAKGPAKKAAEVEEDRWQGACRLEINETAKGVVHRPALMFAVATVWMLREVELAAIHKEDILIDDKEKLVTLTLRLTKTDQEGKGMRRTLQCCCQGDCGWEETCPFMITRAALDHIPIEEDKLVHGDKEDEVTKGQIIEAWRKLFGKKVSGHSGRRSGALQYIRRGWHVPQVAYLGRWKFNVILEYAEEALESMPVKSRKERPASTTASDKDQREEVKNVNEAKVKEITREMEARLKLEVEKLKVAQDKLEDSLDRWEKMSAKHQGLLPPTVISKNGTIHENKRQPIASPVMSWHTKCGWPYGASNFAFGTDPTTITCLKCITIAPGNEERFGNGGA